MEGVQPDQMGLQKRLCDFELIVFDASLAFELLMSYV